MTFSKLFFSFEGRSGRKAYWAGIIAVEIGIIIAGVICGLIHVPALIAVLVFAYPRICVIAKRFHDINRTGWWQVLPNIASNVAAGGGAVLLGQGGTAVGLLLSLVIEWGFLIWLGSMAGQPHKNDFGQPEGQKDVAEVFL